MLVALLAAALLVQADSVTLGSGARSPAYASDGRLAVSLRGDIWVLHPAGGRASARRVTGGPAWDRDPAWSADGRWIVFASDRAGSVDLWRIDVTAAGSVEPVQLTAGPEAEDQPTVSPRGEIAYVTGSGGLTDLWLLEPGGAARRLTGSEGAEREPAFSPDGSRIAYVAEREAGRTLRLLTLSDGRDAEIAVDRPVHGPSWAPDGRRLAFATGPRTPGIWVVDVGGSLQARASETSGVPAWSPDGRWIAVADAAPADAGYNGDPDRLGDRSAGDVFREGGGGLRLVAAPRAPDPESVELRITAQLSREAYNADAFDRVWERTLRLYGGAAVPDAWQRLRESYRLRAVRAATDEELEAAIHAMLRARPAARRTAAGGAAVSSAHALATAAGVEVLEAGGNVVDAAVAVSFALGVVEPDASGVGGYGEMLVHLDGMPEPAAIEFMTRLPEASSLATGRSGPLPPDGPRLANVPGTVAGMELAWRRYGSGKVSWARLIEPAIRLAERGFAIDDAFATTLRRERDAFAKYEGSRRLFLRDGVPLAAGDTLRNPDLAWTLRQIADGGAEAFYRGEPARRLVADLRAGGIRSRWRTCATTSRRSGGPCAARTGAVRSTRGRRRSRAARRSSRS